MGTSPRAPRWLRYSMYGFALAGLSIPLVAHAVGQRREAHAVLSRLRVLEEELSSLERHAEHARRARTNGQRIIVNGAPIFFRASTARVSLGSALDEVRSECKSGERRTMLGGASPRSAGEDRPALAGELRLVRVDRHEIDGAGAILCTFEEGAGTMVRYSLAKRVDSGTTSVVTIATESDAALESLFPAEGDAPGDDFDGVPRPRGSRRVFAATLEDDAVLPSYGVRIYEASSSLPETVATYDTDMAARGWQRGEAVARAAPDARVYARGPVKMVASFQSWEGLTSVTIAPLESERPLSR